MAIKHVVTLGFGFADNTAFIPTIGFSIGALQVPDQDSLDWTFAERLPEWTFSESRMEFTFPERLLEWTFKE